MKNSQTSYRKTTKTGLGKKLPTIKIAFLDVGQADTIVISCPDTHEAIIVDCVNAKEVLNYLKKEQITHLRGIIITHLHADHYSGVAALLNSYHLVPGLQECEVLACNELSKPKNLQKLSSDIDGHSATYEQPQVGGKILPPSSLGNLVEWCKQHKLRCSEIKVEHRSLPFEGTLARSLQLVHPYHVDYADLKTKGLNNTSVVLRIEGSGSSALLTGDLEPEGWQQLKDNHLDVHSDVLKFPHHGAWKDADVEELLDKIQPSVVVISVGSEGYKYKHPNSHVFTALFKHPNIRVLCTQATDQCRELVHLNRESVLQQLRSQADANGYSVIGSKQGCPCAGTVIIELRDEARVLQPEMRFHHQSIIKPHFGEHKCNIEYNSLVGKMDAVETEMHTY